MEVRRFMIQFNKILSSINLYRKAFLSLSIDRAAKYLVLFSIMIISLIVRLLPLRYGIYINEFDPYVQYYATNVIVDAVEKHGLSGFLSFFTHHIDLTWQPEGVDLGSKYHPGVPYTGAVFYFLLRGLGLNITTWEIAVFLPVLYGVISVFIIYLIGKIVKGEFVGLMAALFYAVAPSIISRSNLGWYDTDGIGMLYLLLSIYFLFVSLNSEKRIRRLLLSTLSGIFAGLLGLTWGAFPYIYVLYAVLTILIIILYGGLDDYEYSYFPAIIIMTIIVSSVPSTRLNYVIGYLALLQYMAASLLVMSKIFDLKFFFKSKLRLIGAGSFIASLAVLLFSFSPYLGLSSRQLIVALPIFKSRFVFATTVQEQAGTSFIYFFRDLHVMIPFSIFGLYVILKEYKSKEEYKIRMINLLMILIFLSTLYAAATFVRLIILAVPFLAITGAIGIYEIVRLGLERIYSSKKTKHVRSDLIKNLLVVFVVSFILMSSSITYVFSINRSMYPPTILTGGSPYRSNDWLQALEWIKANVKDDEIIASWWDYGYWISFIAGKKTLADNGTLNQSRIKLLAEMFLSDESHALKILKKLNASYVLIYIGSHSFSSGGFTYYILEGFGEDGKFIQMARIAGIDPNTLYNPNNREGSIYTESFWNTFLGKLIPYTFLQKQPMQNRLYDIYMYSPKYPTSPSENAKLILVFRSSDPAPGEVLIYKIVDD